MFQLGMNLLIEAGEDVIFFLYQDQMFNEMLKDNIIFFFNTNTGSIEKLSTVWDGSTACIWEKDYCIFELKEKR